MEKGIAFHTCWVGSILVFLSSYTVLGYLHFGCVCASFIPTLPTGLRLVPRRESLSLLAGVGKGWTTRAPSVPPLVGFCVVYLGAVPSGEAWEGA